MPSTGRQYIEKDRRVAFFSYLYCFLWIDARKGENVTLNNEIEMGDVAIQTHFRFSLSFVWLRALMPFSIITFIVLL